MKYKYTTEEVNELLASMIILVDTREKVNSHIIDEFKKNGIKFKSKALRFGDYAFMIPENSKLGIDRDLYFSDDIVIERKNGVDELVQTITNRTTFENELMRCNFKGAKMYLLVEDCNGYEKIFNGDYRSEYTPNALNGSIETFKHRYNIDINYLDNKDSARFIYNTFKYYLLELYR